MQSVQSFIVGPEHVLQEGSHKLEIIINYFIPQK